MSHLKRIWWVCSFTGFPLGLENLTFSSEGKVREFCKDWKSQGKSHKILETQGIFRQMLFVIFLVIFKIILGKCEFCQSWKMGTMFHKAIKMDANLKLCKNFSSRCFLMRKSSIFHIVCRRAGPIKMWVVFSDAMMALFDSCINLTNTVLSLMAVGLKLQVSVAKCIYLRG